MKCTDAQHRFHVIVSISTLILLAVVAAVLGYLGYLSRMTTVLWEAFQGREQFRSCVESWGTLAPVAFMSLQALQVVVAPIPGELTGAAGGFIFGAVPNIAYSTVGLTIGSLVAFLSARIVGLPLVKLAVPCEMMERFEFLTKRKGALLALGLFAIPGFPKDILCFLLGLSPMGFVSFATVCTVGRIPGTVMLSYSGAAVYNENWWLVVILAAVALLAIAVFFLFRDRFEWWVKKRSCGTA
jgi:uncharacterized membrane protein YdjX (TVP38/TMEM64 family)